MGRWTTPSGTTHEDSFEIAPGDRIAPGEHVTVEGVKGLFAFLSHGQAKSGGTWLELIGVDDRKYRAFPPQRCSRP